MSRQSQVWIYRDGAISQEDYRDMAVGPLAALRRLESVTIEGVSDSVAKELETIMTGDSALVDFPRTLNSLEEYVDKFESDHCKICAKIVNYMKRATTAADVEDEAAFREVRETIFSLVQDHRKFDRSMACQYDPCTDANSEDPSNRGSAMKPSYPLMDDPDADIDFAVEWALDQADWDFRSDETDAERQQREKQEQQRPSLVRLRAIALYDQIGYYPEGPYSD